MSGKTLFVVLGESGDYSQRSVWVAGVFETKEEAQALMAERIARSRAHTEWYEASLRHREKRPFNYFTFPLSPEQEQEFEAIRVEGERKAGPKPEYEPAERVELFEVPFGEWQKAPLPEIASESVHR